MKGLPERISSKFEVGGECWIWRAAKSHGGYGVVHYEGRQQAAHRVVYQVLVGTIPAGRDIDHLCRTPACVNPAHLEPVSHRENLMRGEGPIPQRARQSHCIHGHAFDAANTRIRSNGTRACRACNRRRCTAAYRRRAGHV